MVTNDFNTHCERCLDYLPFGTGVEAAINGALVFVCEPSSQCEAEFARLQAEELAAVLTRRDAMIQYFKEKGQRVHLPWNQTGEWLDWSPMATCSRGEGFEVLIKPNGRNQCVLCHGQLAYGLELTAQLDKALRAATPSWQDLALLEKQASRT